MNIQHILEQLKTERDRLDRAITALNGAGPKSAEVSRRRTGKRKMSAAGRRRLSEMMKARWAARKRKGKRTLA